VHAATAHFLGGAVDEIYLGDQQYTITRTSSIVRETVVSFSGFVFEISFAMMSIYLFVLAGWPWWAFGVIMGIITIWYVFVPELSDFNQAFRTNSKV
jgi:membrane protein YdbS with pleckstrin-like domain